MDDAYEYEMPDEWVDVNAGSEYDFYEETD
jgi:hypothetical protein